MSLFSRIRKAFEDREALDDSFHPQFQLLSRARDEENEDNLAMRTADPLWMLGRQWQFGEFVGEDNGSPISVQGFYVKKGISTYATLNNQNTASLGSGPLEVQVEAMSIPLNDLRTRVKVGQKFERLIRQKYDDGEEAQEYIDQLRSIYPLEESIRMDKASSRFYKLMKGKTMDGRILIEKLTDEQFDTDGFSSLVSLRTQLINWYENLYSQPNRDFETWNPNQLVHQFSAKTPGDQVVIHAPDYQSGHLDWYSFDSVELKENLDAVLREEEQATAELLPTNLTFPAMPEKRLFAFEDRKIDLGDQNIEADDLIRIMLVDFSLFSGSDWYTIPMEMEIGEICWINRIEVKDVFGVRTTIQNKEGIGPSFSDVDGDGRQTSLDIWDVFKIRNELVTKYHHPENFLYLAPTLNHRQESQPIEEVLFLRDEFANMVWGLEKRIRNGIGKTVEGFDYHLELNGPFEDLQSADEETEERLPIYRLATTVPSHWIPYLPRQEGPKQLVLKRAKMVSNEPDKMYRDIEPLSYLTSRELLLLREEAVPKAGVRVQLTKQRARWTDGKTYVWMGRKVLAGKGEGNSGLRFDALNYRN